MEISNKQDDLPQNEPPQSEPPKAELPQDNLTQDNQTKAELSQDNLSQDEPLQDDHSSDESTSSDDSRYQWYVVQVYSGFEQKVSQSLEMMVEHEKLSDVFKEILVPTEEVVEVRRGARVKRERKFFPGYILIQMIMTDEAWHLVSNTPKVTGFLGGSRADVMPVNAKEMSRILHQVQEGGTNPKPSVTFEIGEQVRVCDGPFASFNGLVEDVDEEKTRLKVSVSIFGRATPVDLDYAQVEKV